jgi:hypothetical protein
MQLELADCGTTKKNNSVMLPAMDSATGQIFMINQSAFNSMDESEKRQFVAELPTTLMALKNKGMADMPGTGRALTPAEILKERVEAERERQALLYTPTEGYPVPRPPAPGQTPGSRFSVDLDVEPDSKPWFAQTPVIIGGAVLILALGYALKRK